MLNDEQGGENCILHGDTQSESMLTDVSGEPLLDARNLNVESNFEFGSRVGFWEIMRVLQCRRVDAVATTVACSEAPTSPRVGRSSTTVAMLSTGCMNFDWLYEQGREGRPRMMSIGVHGRIIGRPGRIGALVKLLDHMQRHEDVWLCNREGIARHWMAQHPPVISV